MPGRNKTGPSGMGPMTGRGMGDCTGDEKNGNFYGYGRGAGFFGWGRGRGFRGGFGFGAGRRDFEKDSLEGEMGFLKRRLSFLEELLKKQSDNDK